MKKIFRKLLLSVLGGVSAVALSGALTGCFSVDIGIPSETHKHEHWTEWAVTLSPTCLQEGIVSRYCGTCGQPENMTISPLGHLITVDEAVKATCEKPGKTKGSHCMNCGFVVEAQQEIAPAHQIETKTNGEIPAPSCTGPSTYESIEYCTVCDREFNHKTLIIPQKEHTMSEIKQEILTAPTCLTEGTAAQTVYCESCEEVLIRKEISIPMLGHEVQLVVNKAPTCEQEGEMIYACIRCGENDHIVEVEKIPHKFTLKKTKIEPTCTQKGVEISICEVCQKEGEQSELPALGHSLVNHKAVSPTCEMPGWEDYVACNRCNISTYRELAPTGHDFVIKAEVAASCSKSGHILYACSRCDEENKKELPVLAHEFIQEITLPDCENGGKIVFTCKNCQHSYTEKTGEAMGHDFKEYSSNNDATCQKDGTMSTFCTTCGKEIVKPEEGSRKEHSYNVVTTRPTCEEDGYSVSTCAVCGHIQRETGTKALGHSYGEYLYNHDESCGKDGTMSAICTTCGKQDTKTVSGTAKEHSWKLQSENEREEMYNCEYCGVSKRVEKPETPIDPELPEEEKSVKIITQNHRNNTSETCTITLLKEGEFRVEYAVDSEEFDVFTVTIGKFHDEISGRDVSKSMTINLKIGDKIVIAYTKDDSDREGLDQGYIILYGLTDEDILITR